MKYKRGSIVEVLTKDEVPYHSWRRAQIVSGNGHDYTVRYDMYPGFIDKGDVERVSRKSFRPCPPPVKFSDYWVPGDVLEVFHDLSWKMAIVSKALGRDKFLVRLVGSFQEFEISKSELRVRQCWQNDEWIVIGKVPMHNEDGRHNKLLKYNLDSRSQDRQRDAKRNLYMKDLCSGAQDNYNLQESRLVSSRTLKRGSPYYYSQGEVNEGTARKFRLAEKEGRRLRVLLTSPEKVDTSSDNIATRFYEDGGERENTTDAYRCARGQLNDEDSAVSSVGSCSINSHKPYKMHRESVNEGDDNDAESVCQVGFQKDLVLSPSNEELMAEIHRLELHAYRCTMEALHASGPLSWEKESMIKGLFCGYY